MIDGIAMFGSVLSYETIIILIIRKHRTVAILRVAMNSIAEQQTKLA
jgi:hypothetical protein